MAADDEDKTLIGLEVPPQEEPPQAPAVDMAQESGEEGQGPFQVHDPETEFRTFCAEEVERIQKTDPAFDPHLYQRAMDRVIRYLGEMT